MKPLYELLIESMGQDKARKAAIERVAKALGFKPDPFMIKYKGEDLDVKVHAMPFKDKCLIVNYDDLVSREKIGMIFINKLTDFQNVVYIIHDRKALKSFIDTGLDTRNRNLWPSNNNERKIFDNPNFFGITIKLDALEQQGWFETITL